MSNRTTSNNETAARPVQYLMPTDESLEKLAHATCRELGGDYYDLDVENGLIGLLKLAAKIEITAANGNGSELSEAA